MLLFFRSRRQNVQHKFLLTASLDGLWATSLQQMPVVLCVVREPKNAAFADPATLQDKSDFCARRGIVSGDYKHFFYIAVPVIFSQSLARALFIY